jgi:nucleoside-diphosphate-sugar epimerase
VTTALIGHSGFVGGNLARQWTPDRTFNSSTIEAFAGGRYELVVCAGTYAEKWRINAEPGPDLANIERLSAILATASIDRLVLISTVDVFPVPDGVDEDSPIDETVAQPYGRHRRWLERSLASRFPTTVVRLAGLFGDGLKKNALFDLLHDHQVDRLNPEGTFQFYDIGRLWADLETAIEHRLPVIHLVTQPVALGDVARVVFGRALARSTTVPAAHYDCRTRHAPLFGGSGHYLSDQGEVLVAIRDFVERERRAR